jgi:PAS domain S-box-containing protein
MIEPSSGKGGARQLTDGSRDFEERRLVEEELRHLNRQLSEQALHLREVNQTLQDSEQRLRLAIETGKIGLWIWNSTDVKNSGDWSPRLKEIFGLPPDAEVTHEMFLKCVHPEDRARVDQAVMMALSGVNQGEYRAEYRTIHPHDGSEHWVTARGQAFFDANGQAVRFIGTVMDATERKHVENSMTRMNLALEQRIAERTADLEQANRALQAENEERKRAEEALHRSEDYLRLAIDTIPGLVWTSLPDGHIEYLNKRWLEYTGMRQEEATGWGWQAAIHADDLDGLATYWRSILRSGEAGRYEARLRRFDGEYRWFLFKGVPLRDEHGTVVKWYGTNTDIEAMRVSEHLARGQLEALSQTLTALSQESEPEKVLEHVLRTIGQQLKSHSLGVWEMNQVTGRVELIGNCEGDRLQLATSQENLASRVVTPPRDHPVWSEFFRSGQQFVFGEMDAESARVRLADGPDTAWYDWMGDPVDHPQVRGMMKRLVAAGVVATLMVPMLVAGKVVGFLSIRFREKRAFSSEELELTRALSHQAMLALQLLRLSQQSRQAAVEAERNRMARDIHDTLAQGFTGVIVQLEAAEEAQARGLANDAAAHM